MIWPFGRDFWGAFGLTFLLMMLWEWTPLGSWEVALLQWLGSQLAHTPVAVVGRSAEKALGAPLILWTWPITAIVFFWTARIFLRRVRLKKEAIASVEPSVTE